MQPLGRKNARKADAEFVVNVDDVRMKVLHQLQTAPAEGRGYAISVKAFAFDGGAVKNSVLDIMMAGLVIRGDDQNFVSLLQKTIAQDFYMSHYPIDMRQIRFGK